MDLKRMKWRKSIHSTNNGGHCVELAALPGIVAVRDSKNPNGPALAFARDAFRAFTTEVKAH